MLDRSSQHFTLPSTQKSVLFSELSRISSMEQLFLTCSFHSYHRHRRTHPHTHYNVAWSDSCIPWRGMLILWPIWSLVTLRLVLRRLGNDHEIRRSWSCFCAWFSGGYLSIFSMFCCWSGLSWQRLSVVNGGVLGRCVRGVDDHRPLRAAAVLAAAGLVSLTTSIPGDQDACKDCYGQFRMTGPVLTSDSKYLTLLMPWNSIINPFKRNTVKDITSSL